MKTALICFGDTDVLKIVRIFRENGVEITTADILPVGDDIGFRRRFETLRDTADALIISAGAEFDVKDKISEFTEIPLAENENARKFLITIGAEDFSGALMPIDATFLPNDKGAYQGFILEEQDFTVAVLSGVTEEFIYCAKKYLSPYLTAKTGVTDKFIFKCFGEQRFFQEIFDNIYSDHRGKFDGVIKEVDCDVTISLFFKTGEDEKREILRRFTAELKEYMYAEGDTTLSEALFTLLKITGKHIAVAESFTGGALAENIVKNSGASEFFCEGIVAYSNDSKIKRLQVPYEDIIRYGAVSAKVAYRMAAGLFNMSDCDIAVATTGLAGPNGDGSGKPVGTCFIAVGKRDGIHTYGFEFTGTREEITKKGVNAATFYAVKTIKNV